MLITSQAGEFEINIIGFEREGNELIMVGAMGVWEARTHVTPKDAVNVVWKLISSASFWGYAFMLPVLLLKKS